MHLQVDKCFSINFHGWDINAVQNFILNLLKFGRIKGEEDKMVWKTSMSGFFCDPFLQCNESRE